MHTPTQNIDVELALVDSDIGGTNDISKWIPMTGCGAVTFIAQLGKTFEGTADNWNASDQLDTFKLRQATDSAGSDVKDITGAANNQTAANAAGERHAITVNAEALDVAGGFTHVAAYVAEDDNTGVDIVSIIAIKHAVRFKHDDLGATSHVVV